MKKILLFICVTISVNSFGQPKLDTVPNQSITLRIKDIGWFIDKQGQSSDSVSSKFEAKILKIIEDTVNVYGRNVSMNKTTTITNVPAVKIVLMYHMINTATLGQIRQMGTTNAERLYVLTQLTAISNSTIQYYYVIIDTNDYNEYINSLMRTWWKVNE